MTVARTAATGGALHPEVLEFETSLPVDKRLYRLDIIGSAAHVVMLSRCGIIPAEDARKIRDGLFSILADADAEKLVFEGEEDIHMAIEAELARRIGEPGRLHTARSRNDQVALDARLYVRERSAAHLTQLSDRIESLVTRAASEEGKALMPGYTHRQRAQPIRAAYLFLAYANMLVRDAETFSFVLQQTDALALGVGALTGTSLPTDREITRALLGFSRVTANGLDTVGDRDFALDFVYAATRCMLHIGRISTDVVDFSTDEFGFFELDGSIACGSSMMPQKKNPDVFELLRAKSAGALGNFVALATLVKGLPVGYMRDLQEDKHALFDADDRLDACLRMLSHGLAGIRIRPERTEVGIREGFTQATDLAERLVSRGHPFRIAYSAVGALVRQCVQGGKALSSVTLKDARVASPLFEEDDLRVLDPVRAVEAKGSAGGTGPASIEGQLRGMQDQVKVIRERAAKVPTAKTLLEPIRQASLTR